jgi:hypothetical protein
VVPSNAAEDCVEFYENVFNLLKPRNQGQTLDFASLVGQMSMSSASANKEKSTLRRTGIRKPDTSILKGVQGQQFRLVDSEEFVVGTCAFCTTALLVAHMTFRSHSHIFLLDGQ